MKIAQLIDILNHYQNDYGIEDVYLSDSLYEHVLHDRCVPAELWDDRVNMDFMVENKELFFLPDYNEKQYATIYYLGE